MIQRHVLECQDCGDVVRELSAAEAQQVADKPYDFVVYCDRCKRLGPIRRSYWGRKHS